MSFTVFNQKDTDLLNQPIFLGENLNVARFDQMKYRFMDMAAENQLSLFWMPTEVDVSKDRRDFALLDKGQQYIFMANLRYQTLLDSIQERAPSLAFGALVSVPEFEGFIAAWECFEFIHSRSYTHILRNVVDDPDEVFSNIVVDEHIIKRATALSTAYDELIELNMLYTLYGYGHHYIPSRKEKGDVTPRVMRRAIIKALATVNALEGVRFQTSFLTTYSFAEKLNAMLGSVKVVRFINRDEDVHRKTIGDTLKVMAAGREGPEWQADFEAMIPEMEAIYQETYEQECEWADHLFDEGRHIPGINAAMIKDYLKMSVNRTMQGSGVPGLFTIDFAHPVPWVTKYQYSGNVQVAPQEAEISAYVMGRIDSEVNQETLQAVDLGLNT